MPYWLMKRRRTWSSHSDPSSTSLVVKLGYAKPGEHYKPNKAIYGLRQSPKKWSSYRDRKLMMMVTKDDFIFRPSVAEPNLWKILKTSREESLSEIEEINSELFGFVLVYVDDLMILSEDYIVQQVVEVLQSCRKNGTPLLEGRK